MVSMPVLCIPEPCQLPLDSLGLINSILSPTVTELDFGLCEDAGVSLGVVGIPGLGLSFHPQLLMAIFSPLLWVLSPDSSVQFGPLVPPAAVWTFGTGTSHWCLPGEF